MAHSPKMTDTDIEKAVRLLDAWTGKLNWARFLALLSTEIGHLYTKMAIHKGQPRILDAWNRAKDRLKTGVESVGAKSSGDAAIVEMHRRIDKLKARNATLEQENNDLLEQFRLWATNAVSHGLTLEKLNRPLPAVR